MIEILGWLGAIGLLSAFALSSLGKLDNKSNLYQVINLISSILLIINAYFNDVIPFVVINTFWGLIALFAIYRINKK